MLCPLVDATDREWAAWTGAEPAAIVRKLLADSLGRGRGREVVLGTLPPGAAVRPVEDEVAVGIGRQAGAEVVVTGVVCEFTHEDRREPGKFSRWGLGPPDARSHAEVRVSLRALDVRDGSVILESAAGRERRRRSTASVGRPLPEAGEGAAAPSGPLAEALDEVVADLVHAIDKRLDDRWQASVVSLAGETCVLDAGAGRGLFRGERLDVWRAGIETYDEEFLRLGEEVRVGVLVVVALDGRGRARARVAEGEVRPGDRVRPCSGDWGARVTLRR